MNKKKDIMKFVDFFPYYPDVNDPSFYQKLYEQKEFYDLSHKGKTNTFFNHQIIPQRFLSPWSFYQSLLLLHDTGTGKSGSVSAVIDLLKNYNEKTTIVYVTNNDTLVRNFKDELLKLCPWVKKNRKEFQFSESTFFKRYLFLFTTFGSFEKDIQKLSLFQLKNSFIVLDEAHHLITKFMTNYQVIYKFLQKIPDRKLMVLTATPMRDDALELIYLLNLVLPSPLPTGPDFITEYLTIRKENQIDLYEWKPKKDVEFRERIRGYVSVFRQRIENVDIKYCGEKLSNDMFTTLYVDKMEDYQNNIYMKTWGKTSENQVLMDSVNREEEGNVYDTLYNFSIQSSLFVFPGGSYGTPGAQQYSTNGYKFNNRFFKDTTMILNPKTDNEIRYNLNTLKKYSIVYHNLIKNIMKAKEKGKLIYVYSEKINGSGILRCISLLEQCFQFSRLTTPNSNIFQTPTNRFIFLHDNETIPLINLYNDSRNKNGEFIRVIFGTDKTTEGITLKNVQEIHIITPGWNFGKKNQAQGRGYRLGSHADFGGKKMEVQVYLHCAVPRSLDDSVNFLQYTRSETKERNIYLFSYALLIAAMDCQMNYYQNYQQNDLDFSSQCYLKKCSYQCDGIDPDSIASPTIQEGTYNSYFVDSSRHVVQEITNLFLQDSSPKTLEQLYHHFSNQKFSMFQIYYAIMEIISSPIPIPIYDGTKRFLLHQDGYLYLSSDRHSVLWNVKHPDFRPTAMDPKFRIEKNTELVKEDVYRDRKLLLLLLQQWKTVLESEKIWETTTMFQRFPTFLQDLLVEQFPLLLKLKEGRLNERTRTVNFGQNTPKSSVPTPMELERLEKNKYGFYGIHEKDSFKIRENVETEKIVDKRKLTKGQFIKTVEIPRIIHYIVTLKPKMDDTFLSILPSSGKETVKTLMNVTQTDLTQRFHILEEKYKYFANQEYDVSQKKMIVILTDVFGNRRQPLIQLLETEMTKRNLFLK